jgi:hypothetical protein
VCYPRTKAPDSKDSAIRLALELGDQPGSRFRPFSSQTKILPSARFEGFSALSSLKAEDWPALSALWASKSYQYHPSRRISDIMEDTDSSVSQMAPPETSISSTDIGNVGYSRRLTARISSSATPVEGGSSGMAEDGPRIILERFSEKPKRLPYSFLEIPHRSGTTPSGPQWQSTR